MSTAPSSHPSTLPLSDRDALTVAAMAAAVAMPVEAFLGAVIATWLEKPRNFRRFAKRQLADAEGKAGDDRRARARKLARALKRARRIDDAGAEKGAAKPGVAAKGKAKPRAKTKSKSKATKPSSAQGGKAKASRSASAIIVVETSPAKPVIAAPALVANG